MKQPLRPSDEAQRLEALRLYDVLDTPPDQALDDLTSLGAHICEAPIALISLVDAGRQWFKSRIGLSATETSRDISFCGHTILERDLFIIPDASVDERFADNPLVTEDPKIRFYAGAPLTAPSGQVLGAFCIMDHVPRELTAAQMSAMRILSRQVISQLELRRQTRELARNVELLRTIFDSEPECVKVLDRDGSVQMMNRAGIAMIEADSLEQVAGHCVYPLVSPEHRARFQTLTDRVFLGESGTMEFQIVGLKGTPRWLETHATPLRDEHGNVRSLLGITRDITERRRVEETLRVSRELLKSVINNIPSFIFATDRQHRYTLVNHAYARYLKKQPSEILHRTHHDFYPREVADGFVAANETIMQSGETFQRDENVLEATVMTVKFPLQDAQGNVCGICGVATDITGRKQAEIHIRRLNRVYAVLSDINQAIAREPDSPALLRAACQIAVEKGRFQMAWIGSLRATGGGLEIAAHAGASPETLQLLNSLMKADEPGCAFTSCAWETGRHGICNDIARDAQAAAWRDAALQRGYRAMASLPLKANDQVVATFNLYAAEPMFFDAEELRLLDELATDISFAMDVHRREAERRRVEAALHESDERFRQLAANIHEVFWLTDPEKNQMFYISPGYERIWGRTCRSLYESPGTWLCALHPDDRDRVERAARTKQACGEYDEIYRITRPDGTIRWIHDRAFPIRNEALEVYRVAGTAEDITNRRQLEEQFHHAQKMEAIGQLAGGVAHDFNNILAAILGNAQVALDSSPGEAELRGSLEEILRAVARAKSLVQQILTFSRQQPQERRPMSLGPVIQETASLLRATIPASVDLRVAIDADAPTVLADATQIHQVVLNLCTNAWHALGEQPGVVEISLRSVELDADEAQRLAGLQPGPFVCLTVKDSGAGIHPTILARIFEPFFTTKELSKGTGLGLSVVHGIVQEHDAAITVDSQLGQGATFRIFFPAVAAVTARETASPSSQPALPGPSRHILYLDDEEPLVFVSKRLLQKLGHKVTGFTRATDAMEAIRSNPAQFDLVITDLNMPGTSGLNVAHEILQVRPDLPVLLSSGHVTEEVRRRARSAGIRDVLFKPCTLEEFGHAIHRWTESSRQP